MLHTNKNFRLLISCLHSNIFLKNIKEEAISFKVLNNYSYLSYNFSNNFFLNLLFLPLNFTNQKCFFYQNLKLTQAQLLTDYITFQLSKSYKKKDFFFKRNLVFGILKTMSGVLNYSNNYTTGMISGIKVECSGRWKQTSNGRSQKVRLLLGNVSTQTNNKFISYDYSTTHTKYGSCGIKVWICYNKEKEVSL